MRLIQSATVAVFLPLMANAQSAPQAFEAATIKLTPPDAREPLDVRFTPGGRLTVTNETLRVIVTFAYGIQGWQISGAPGWFDTDRFDISAKAEGDPSRDDMLRMFRALLEDRFRMKVQRETKEGPIYELTVAKNGPKLQEAKPLNDNERADVRTFRTGSPQQTAVSLARVGRHASMAMLASALQGQLSRPVLDHTGIKGDFDFKVEFAADDSHLDEFPSLLTALQDQLGLKLEPAKGPVEMFVIEHVDRVPIEN
jgi:uncharacterized protein (TIGR03435 family)